MAQTLETCRLCDLVKRRISRGDGFSATALVSYGTVGKHVAWVYQHTGSPGLQLVGRRTWSETAVGHNRRFVEIYQDLVHVATT